MVKLGEIDDIKEGEGGMGFHDLYLFNMAMLARQAWRLLTSPDTLCGNVLKMKYFPNMSILQCTTIGTPASKTRSYLANR